MTIEDTAIIMDILTVAYPAFYSKQSDRERVSAAKLWASMFADDDLKYVAAAVKTIIATKPDSFPPSIGEVKQKVHELQEPDEMSDVAAWALVCKAVSNGYYGSHKEYEKLPKEIQSAIGSPNVLKEWSMVDSEIFQTVIMSNFLKSFRVHKQRARDLSLMPPSVKQLISGMAKKMELGDGENHV